MLAFHGLFNTFLWKKIVFEPTFYNVRVLKCCRVELGLCTGTERNALPENIQCKKMRQQEILGTGQYFWLSSLPLGFCPQFQGVSAPSATQIFPD